MSSEEELFEKYIIFEMEKEIAKITHAAEKLLKKNVQSELYDNFKPSVYKRTNELKNSITSKIDINEGVVFFDEQKINHTSVVNDEPVGKFTPKWTDMGHHDSTRIDNKFHNYPEKNYVDRTIKELEQKYGEGCVEKIDD